MKKLIILGIFIMAFVLGVIAWLFLLKTKVFLSTKSPTETYVVELTGDKFRPTFPLMNHKVSFNLYKNNQAIVSNGYVYSGDLFDSDFSEAYPEHKWINQSVLKFGLNIEHSKNISSSIVISNRTNSVVKYLKIMSGKEDMLFVFEMLPNSITTISMPTQSYVSAVGEFENGQIINYKGVNFFGGNESTHPIQNCVSVTDISVIIENTENNGYTGINNSSFENPDVPKVSNCS